MPRTSFYVSLLSGDSSGEYVDQAGLMANIFTSIFTDTSKIETLTKKAPITDCHTEVDVSQTPNGLLGRAVVDFQCDGKVTLDKTKLSQMFKNIAPWKNLKVEKRLVPVEDSEQAGHAVAEVAAVVA